MNMDLRERKIRERERERGKSIEQDFWKLWNAILVDDCEASPIYMEKLLQVICYSSNRECNCRTLTNSKQTIVN